MTPIAHAGHWLINVLYVVPLFLVVAVLGVQSMKSRRELKREGGDARRPPPPPA